MSSFTNSINNIVNSGYLNNITAKQRTQLVESIKNSAIDTVTFSQESKSLFDISQIDSMLDGIFGIPKNITTEQQSQLESIRKGLDGIYSNNSSQLEQIDFEKILKNLGIDGANAKQIQNITNELGSYITERSIAQLFGTDKNDSFSFLSQGYNNILGEKLNKDESKDLGSLSLQLNRLLFNSDDNKISSYLNIFNDLYGLNTPNEKELFDASTLLTERNTLLSSVLLNRSYQSTYSN